MQFYIVPGDELPIYRQIMRQVIDGVAGARLAAGAQLPSQRELAEQLVVSPLTVKKAYDELEREGLIETQRGRGTFVRSDATAVVEPGEQLDRLRDGARRLVSRAHLGGVTLPQLLNLIEEVDAELRSERAAREEGQS